MFSRVCHLGSPGVSLEFGEFSPHDSLQNKTAWGWGGDRGAQGRPRPRGFLRRRPNQGRGPGGRGGAHQRYHQPGGVYRRGPILASVGWSPGAALPKLWERLVEPKDSIESISRTFYSLTLPPFVASFFHLTLYLFKVYPWDVGLEKGSLLDVLVLFAYLCVFYNYDTWFGV